eukprot:851851-Amphidinium_carterae.1
MGVDVSFTTCDLGVHVQWGLEKPGAAIFCCGHDQGCVRVAARGALNWAEEHSSGELRNSNSPLKVESRPTLKSPLIYTPLERCREPCSGGRTGPGRRGMEFR